MPDNIEILEEEVVASIVYSIKNTGECIVDIDLEEINGPIVELFSNLYFGVSTHKFSEATLTLIQEGMEEAGEGEMYDLFCKNLQLIAKAELSGILEESEKTLKPKVRKESEEPCVSPTDFLTGR